MQMAESVIQWEQGPLDAYAIPPSLWRSPPSTPLHTLITRFEESEGMVGSLHLSVSKVLPWGSVLKDISSPRSIT